MIQEFVEAWDKNKGKLEERIKKCENHHQLVYTDLVKMLFETVINPEYDDGWDEAIFNVDDMTVLDHGDYQGTLIFILHHNWYQPSVCDYVYTSVYYGSCSGCDTLQWIQSMGDYEEGATPNEEQIRDYMTLCLHLLQNCSYLKGEE
jgi:hypothetical protein